MLQSRNLLRSAIASKNLGRAQEILQVVKRRSGRRVAFVKEEREIARLVDEARTRENLMCVCEDDTKVFKKYSLSFYIFHRRRRHLS